ncbi:MAG: hypothetical protein KDC12_14335, partial [Flavobacteriales bacterium]|nr:hypothetical protein [Flavobacteriales bacterium]
TASIIARIAPSEEDPMLAAGMFVEAEIISQSFDALALPEEAIVERDGSFLVLAKNPGSETIQFTEVEVLPGAHSNGYIEIKNAAKLDPSASFLAKGAFDLIAE